MSDSSKTTPASVELTPKGIIRMALGGYGNPESSEMADRVEQELLRYMHQHGKDMVVVRNTSGQSIRFFGKNA